MQAKQCVLIGFRFRILGRAGPNMGHFLSSTILSEYFDSSLRYVSQNAVLAFSIRLHEPSGPPLLLIVIFGASCHKWWHFSIAFFKRHLVLINIQLSGL